MRQPLEFQSTFTHLHLHMDLGFCSPLRAGSILEKFRVCVMRLGRLILLVPEVSGVPVSEQLLAYLEFRAIRTRNSWVQKILGIQGNCSKPVGNLNLSKN